MSADPLAAFMQGALTWTPAPAERVFPADDLYVQTRGRIEKAVWRGGTYYRPDWQGVARHSPRRIVDAPDGVCCVLWALGQRLDDHLLLRPDGDLVTILAWEPTAEESWPLPAAVWRGVVAVVAAQSAPPLAPFVEMIAGSLSLEWGPIVFDLMRVGHGRVRISDRLRQALTARLAGVPARADRAALGLAAVAEMAALVGDELRRRAQAAILALPLDAQPAALEEATGAATRGRGERARDIAAAVEALLGEGAV